jgi:hypothetical protein
MFDYSVSTVPLHSKVAYELECKYASVYLLLLRRFEGSLVAIRSYNVGNNVMKLPNRALLALDLKGGLVVAGGSAKLLL